MSRPDPIEYAERLYAAIRDANFSPISFLAFGNAVKEGVAMRNMPRIAVEPFMRVVGEMLDLEAAASQDIVDGDTTDAVVTTVQDNPERALGESANGQQGDTPTVAPMNQPTAPNPGRRARRGKND